jgi:hypothetical protein
MTDLLQERHEDLVKMLVHCRVQIEGKDDPNILDISTDIRSLPGVATVKQTRPLSVKRTSKGKRIIELKISYNPKYLDPDDPNPKDLDACMKVLKSLIKIEKLDMAKLIDHDIETISIKTKKNPIIV